MRSRPEPKTEAGPVTVGDAVNAYIAEREAKNPKTGKDARYRLTLHVLGDDRLAKTALAGLTANDLSKWRASLTTLKPASVNRLMNDLRAALNAAIERHWRELPQTLAKEIEVGLRSLPSAETARHALLDDAGVRRAIDGAYTVDPDLGALVLTLALNNGLISYSAGGSQYVAAAVGGSSENPSTVAGALRVVVYGLGGPDAPNVITLDRLAPSAVAGWSAGRMLYVQACGQCHGNALTGGSAPPLMRQSQLADPALLKLFLSSAPPPMPRLYPSVVNDDDVRLLADWFRTDLFKCGSPDAQQSCEVPRQPKSGGTKEWQAIYSVLTSPRCVNCHPVASTKLPLFMGLFPQDYPRQGDDRHPHYYSVVRGETISAETAEKTGVHVDIGVGAPFERCAMCHGGHNDDATGIPGTEDPAHPGESFWGLAPASMAFESSPGVTLTGHELCARLKDKSRNGNRELADTLHHIATEPLILWSWKPGKRASGESRTTPPVSHDDFVADFSKWMDDGAPCPDD
jgi:mono/diheme cytochrome c family protein